MPKVTRQMALDYHEQGKHGKIEITPTKPYQSQLDLSLAYSPGVAYPCEAIESNPDDAYLYTNKGNLVAVISNGTAVLGLGNIGPLAGKPVMEGKALLFKIFAGLDSFDIEVAENDPDRFVEIVKALQPTFGGINLEDIKAPECFKIEQRLKEECDIPVMHDDQHGTAIISGAGLINALEIQGKKIEDIRLVVNGAGAAAISCTRLYISLGVRKENILMCDSHGVIRTDRTDLNEQKKEFARESAARTLADAMKDADVFLGLSVADVVTEEMVRSMAPKPIIFALANPDPEIAYETALKARPDAIVATGRSDYPNQINNVIGFPYIFRGALDCGATCINEEMKIAAVRAIAALAKLPVPSVVDHAYGDKNLHFGPEYILPKALDPRLLTTVAPAVARAAVESGIARRPITDWRAYDATLQSIMGHGGTLMRGITELAARNPQRVVFTEGNTDNVIEAAEALARDGVLKPILLGNADMIERRAARLGLSLAGIEIVNPRADEESQRRARFAARLSEKRCREGITSQVAADMMFNRTTFGLMMVECGEADALVAGINSAGKSTSCGAREIIGLKDGYSTFATIHILPTRRGTYFLADTGINPDADARELADISRLAAESTAFFGQNPVCAILSYSNFGSCRHDAGPRRAAEAVAMLHRDYPEIEIDGEMQANYALDTALRDSAFPFSTIKGKDVNTLIFPDLDSANIACRMLMQFGVGDAIGPVTIGLRKSVHFINVSAPEREIVNLATIAALDAACRKG